MSWTEDEMQLWKRSCPGRACRTGLIDIIVRGELSYSGTTLLLVVSSRSSHLQLLASKGRGGITAEQRSSAGALYPLVYHILAVQLQLSSGWHNSDFWLDIMVRRLESLFGLVSVFQSTDHLFEPRASRSAISVRMFHYA